MDIVARGLGTRARVETRGVSTSLIAFGAIGDGTTDDSTAFMAAAQAGATLRLGGLAYKISGSRFLPDDVSILGPGQILFTNDADFIRFGARNRVEDVTFVGTLSTTTNFEAVARGVTSLFSAPTYQSHTAATLDGSDFTHSLSGDLLTVGLPSALTSALGRFAVSAMLALDPAEKYVIDCADDFVTGDAAAPIQLWTTDGSGNEVAQVTLAGGGPLNCFTGASGLKLKLGCSRHDHTKLNLSAVFDLSKITIYRVLNDLAAGSVGNGVEGGTNLDCYSADTIIENCTFTRMKRAAFKAVNSTRVKVMNCVVRDSLGAITTETSVDDEIVGNDIDLRLLDTDGNRVPTGLSLRNHGVIGGANCRGTLISGNRIKGASWAIENAENGTLSNRMVISRNEIDAVHCGISASSLNGRVHHNNIKCSPIMFAGIELPTADKSVCAFNSIYVSTPAVLGYGIASSNTSTYLKVWKNTIRANHGISIAIPDEVANNDHNLWISDNDIEFWTCAIYNGHGGASIINNRATCLGRFSGAGLSPSAALYTQGSFYRNIIRGNYMDGAAAYCANIAGAQDISFEGNRFHSFGATYDVVFNLSASYSLVAKVDNNVIRSPAGTPFFSIGTVQAGTRMLMRENRSETNGGSSIPLNSVSGIGGAYHVNSSEEAAVTTAATSYTVGSSDGLRPTVFTSSSAITITLPDSSSLLTLRGVARYIQSGTGAITLAASGSATVSMRSGGSLTSPGQYSVLNVLHVATNTFIAWWD